MRCSVLREHAFESAIERHFQSRLGGGWRVEFAKHEGEAETSRIFAPVDRGG